MSWNGPIVEQNQSNMTEMEQFGYEVWTENPGGYRKFCFHFT